MANVIIEPILGHTKNIYMTVSNPRNVDSRKYLVRNIKTEDDWKQLNFLFFLS